MKKLHPAFIARAEAVKAAHAHLSKNSPGFKQQHPHARVKQVQQHVTANKGKYGC